MENKQASQIDTTRLGEYQHQHVEPNIKIALASDLERKYKESLEQRVKQLEEENKKLKSEMEEKYRLAFQGGMNCFGSSHKGLVLEIHYNNWKLNNLTTPKGGEK